MTIRIPLHGNSSWMVRLDHWMDMISLRRGDDGFRKPRTSRKRAKNRGPVQPTRVERIAKKAFADE